MIGEIVRNTKFGRQQLRDQLKLEEESQHQQYQIAAQRELLEQLSTPIIPLLQSCLLIPLIGTIDLSRAQQIIESVLNAVALHRARIVLIDITGIPAVDAAVAGHFRQITQAVALLGARAVLVGLSAKVAATLGGLGIDLSELVVERDLTSAIAFALRTVHLQIVPIQPRR